MPFAANKGWVTGSKDCAQRAVGGGCSSSILSFGRIGEHFPLLKRAKMALKTGAVLAMTLILSACIAHQLPPMGPQDYEIGCDLEAVPNYSSTVQYNFNVKGIKRELINYEADRALKSSLKNAGYQSFFYHKVNRGFAFSTLPERISENAEVIKGEQRWVPNEPKGFFQNLHSFFVNDNHDERFFLFLVSPTPLRVVENWDWPVTSLIGKHYNLSTQSCVPKIQSKIDHSNSSSTSELSLFVFTFHFKYYEGKGLRIVLDNKNETARHLERAGIDIGIVRRALIKK